MNSRKGKSYIFLKEVDNFDSKDFEILVSNKLMIAKK